MDSAKQDSHVLYTYQMFGWIFTHLSVSSPSLHFTYEDTGKYCCAAGRTLFIFPRFVQVPDRYLSCDKRGQSKRKIGGIFFRKTLRRTTCIRGTIYEKVIGNETERDIGDRLVYLAHTARSSEDLFTIWLKWTIMTIVKRKILLLMAQYHLACFAWGSPYNLGK